MNAQPQSSLTGRRLLAVFAHPDDESLACGGTIALCAAAGVQVSLLCLTRGERGNASGLVDHTPNDLAEVRQAELRRAAQELGIHDVIVRDYVDGYLPWTAPGLLVHEIRATIESVRPDAIVTFGYDGLYWYRDHIAVHQHTVAAVASLEKPAPLLYGATMPVRAMRRIVEEAGIGWGADGVPRVWGVDADAFGLLCAPPSVIVDVSMVASVKLAALRCHESQIAADNPIGALTDEQAARLLGTECFHRIAQGDTEGVFLEHLAAEAETRSAWEPVGQKQDGFLTNNARCPCGNHDRMSGGSRRCWSTSYGRKPLAMPHYTARARLLRSIRHAPARRAALGACSVFSPTRS